MLPSDLKNGPEIAALLFALTQDEGESVEIISPNTQFGGTMAEIIFRGFNIGESPEDFSEVLQKFSGENVVECLRKALADMTIRKGETWSIQMRLRISEILRGPNCEYYPKPDWKAVFVGESRLPEGKSP